MFIVNGVSGSSLHCINFGVAMDPAVASGPLITTINDLVAVVTYYGLARLLLINIFHI